MRVALLSRLGPDAADAITEFLNLALVYEACESPTVQGFLHWLRVANPAMIILARAHSDEEMRHLLESGADGAVLAERELAFSMTEMMLRAKR